MVWGCIGWDGVGHLVEVEGKMNAEQYVEILEAGLGLGQHFLGTQRANSLPHVVGHQGKPWLDGLPTCFPCPNQDP
jgi:hypothetical protein